MKTFALSRAIITGCSFYLLWSHNADTNPFECLTQKGMKKAYNGGFFLSARNRGLARREEDERSDRPNDPNEQTADFKAELILSIE